MGLVPNRSLLVFTKDLISKKYSMEGLIKCKKIDKNKNKNR